jgi:predicted alpha/beta hydrolase family esterase
MLRLMSSPERWQEKRPPSHLFRLFPQPEWKSPVLREIAVQVEQRLKPHLNPAYLVRRQN